MAATADMRAKLRRMIAEKALTPYSDDVLDDYIEAYPIPDDDEQPPYEWDGDSWEDNADWTATYDLHAAAAEIWLEKAGELATGKYSDEAQKRYENMMKIREQHLAKVDYRGDAKTT